MKALFLFIFLFSTFLSGAQVSGHQTRFSKAAVTKDMLSKNTRKYETDNFLTIKNDALIQKGIIQNLSSLENNTTMSGFTDVFQAVSCDSGTNQKWTSTIYNIDGVAGTVTCLVAPVGDLHNPVGLFKIKYQKMKKYYSKDLDAAKKSEAAAIAEADLRFEIIKKEKKQIKDSVVGGNNYLSIPELIIATLLTDDSIIDVVATKDNNKIELKNNYTSSVMTKNGETDNKDYILNDLESVMSNYTKLSDLSMTYLIYLLSFFVVFGIGSQFLHVHKTKEKSHGIYSVGLIGGFLLFAPYSSIDSTVTGYDQMNTRFQDFERQGYSLFSSWATDITSAITDTQVDSIISKSGVGTGTQIINSKAGYDQYAKIMSLYSGFNQFCTDQYDTNNMYMTDKKQGYRYSDSSSTPFPTSESWGYAEALYNTDSNYYSVLPKSTNYSQVTRDSFAGLTDKRDDAKLGENYYPQISLSACGKSYFAAIQAKKKYFDYQKTYNSVTGNQGNKNSKIAAIRALVKFQYTLQRDWGFLSVLGLPITKLQTEMIGNLYHQNTEVIDKLNSQIANNNPKSKLLHSMISSIPYMFIPGASNIFNSTLGVLRDINSGVNSSVAGLFGSGVVTSVVASVAGFSFSYMVAKSILAILPILAIISIGLLRFIIIMVKIFVFHFSALFLLPFAFAKSNIQIFQTFSVRILSLMFELPMFVLSVYLSIVANDLIHNIGTLFTKTAILGMVQNNAAQHMSDSFTLENLMNLNFAATDTLKIYLIDGFFEVLVGLFSVFVIYKIIVSMHTSIFELIEMKATSTLDSAAESIKQDASGFGGKI